MVGDPRDLRRLLAASTTYHARRIQTLQYLELNNDDLVWGLLRPRTLRLCCCCILHWALSPTTFLSSLPERGVLVPASQRFRNFLNHSLFLHVKYAVQNNRPTRSALSCYQHTRSFVLEHLVSCAKHNIRVLVLSVPYRHSELLRPEPSGHESLLQTDLPQFHFQLVQQNTPRRHLLAQRSVIPVHRLALRFLYQSVKPRNSIELHQSVHIKPRIQVVALRLSQPIEAKLAQDVPLLMDSSLIFKL